MKKRTTRINIFLDEFPNGSGARAYLESRRWPREVECPFCKKKDRIKSPEGGQYNCENCLADFDETTGTIFRHSHISPFGVFKMIFLLVDMKQSISTNQIAREIGTRNFIAQPLRDKIRLMIKPEFKKLQSQHRWEIEPLEAMGPIIDLIFSYRRSRRRSN